MYKVKSYILLFIVLFLLSFSNSFSVVMVLLNGKIIDKATGKPIATKIKFTDEKGTVHQSNSNSIDGVFQQVLPAGTKLNIIIEGCLIDENQKVLNVPNYDEYTEFGIEYKVDKIDVGFVIATGSIFEKNSTELKAEHKSLFDYIKTIDKSKIGLVYNVNISSSDSYFAPKTVTEKIVEKGKTKTKKRQITSEEQLENLLTKRKEALIQHFLNIGIRAKNLNFTTELIVKKPNPKAKLKTKSNKTLNFDDVFSNNLTIKIERIMKL